MRAWLSDKGVELEDRDFFTNPFSEEELRSLVGSHPPSEVFSWNSPSFKKLGVARETLAGDQLIRLMLDEPRLIRRPLIERGGKLLVGSDKAALEEAFP